MFTEDYLMRIINQAVAALAAAAGLRKAGRAAEAQQITRQSIEALTNLPADLVDQMDDSSILGLLTVQERLDIDRLAVLADLFQEQAEALLLLGQQAQSSNLFASTLRFVLEVALSDPADPPLGFLSRVAALLQRLEGSALPVDTRLALSDLYRRLLQASDQDLAAAGTSRPQLSQALAGLQADLDLSQDEKGE